MFLFFKLLQHKPRFLNKLRLLKSSLHKMFIASAALFMTACNQSYLVTVNQQPVYDPSGRSLRMLVEDSDLQGCINYSSTQQKIEDPRELTVLSCPNSEVRSLVGIEKLPRLQFVDFTDNQINNLTPLENLPRLSALFADDNRITNISTLLSLKGLVLVSLKGNEQIPCEQLERLKIKLGDNLTSPDTCSN